MSEAIHTGKYLLLVVVWLENNAFVEVLTTLFLSVALPVTGHFRHHCVYVSDVEEMPAG